MFVDMNIPVKNFFVAYDFNGIWITQKLKSSRDEAVAELVSALLLRT
jgi:hypothetical protein